MAGGASTLIAGLVVQAAVQPTTSVSDDMWSYPWTAEGLVAVSILWAAMNVVVFYGLLCLGRSGLAGRTRGVPIALAGTALTLIAHLASIPIADARMDDTAAWVVGSLFGVSALISAVGLIITGRAVRTRGAIRYAPMLAGGALIATNALAPFDAIAAGVALYGIGLFATGAAMLAPYAPALRERVA